MQKVSVIAAFLLLGLVACSIDESNDAPPQTGTSACSIDAQKQFVLDKMRDVYFWNDDLPVAVDLATFATPEAVLEHLISFQPLDHFSYIDLAAADAQFFGAGQYEGYGFSSRFEAADDLRFIRVFSSSPAGTAGFARGQRIMMLNGRTIADIEANEGTGSLFTLPTLEFTIRRPDGTEFTSTVNAGIVTIDPLPQHRVIDRPDGTSVGYVELVTFISTADDALSGVFETFRQAGVTDVILDLRYNGGGLVSTTELLGDFLGGGVPGNTVFSRTLFNDNNSAANRTALFARLAESLSLSRLVVITTERTASASELITNSMKPHVEVTIVGSTTLGKPVGQLGIEFCEKILRPTAFETVNSNEEGRYFDGLAADCPAIDDLLIPVGDNTDQNLTTALTFLETGACPAQMIGPTTLQKPRKTGDLRNSGRVGAPWREFAGAW